MKIFGGQCGFGKGAMMGLLLEWATRQWLEIMGVTVTGAALIYAHLAYRVGLLGLAQNKQAELNSFRVQTKAALSEARQAQVALERACQVYRSQWVRHERKAGPMWRREGVGPFERSPIDKVESEGRQRLSQLHAASADIDRMDLPALEALGQKAKAVALDIQALAGKLPSPT